MSNASSEQHVDIKGDTQMSAHASRILPYPAGSITRVSASVWEFRVSNRFSSVSMLVQNDHTTAAATVAQQNNIASCFTWSLD